MHDFLALMMPAIIALGVLSIIHQVGGRNRQDAAKKGGRKGR